MYSHIKRVFFMRETILAGHKEMLFLATLRVNGIIFGWSVSYVATFVVPKCYTMMSQIG